MYVVGLNGSPRSESNVRYLINKVLERCRLGGAETEIIDVPQIINSARQPFCVVCSNPCSGDCYKGTLLEGAFEKIIKADALIIGSPVYFGSMSAQLKAFFDKTRKLRGEKSLIGKPCGFIAVGASRFGGQEATLTAMHAIALVQGMTILGTGHNSYDAGHIGISSQQPSDKDDNAISRCESLAMRIMDNISIH
ncbi:MAG: flavodoxin family protein [Clostridiaceae bacterium]|jgi:multimeric flavodoxin WrbA|nr:flavodoxin family protein [Clostridiaceae bacterium]